MENKNKYCKNCGKKIEKEDLFCTKCGEKTTDDSENKDKKTTSIEKKQNKNSKMPVWAVVLIVFVTIFSLLSLFDEEGESNPTPNSTESKKTVEMIDFSAMTQSDIKNWCEENNIDCWITEDYSDTIPKGKFISQSENAGTKIEEKTYVTIKYSLGKEPTIEQKNALKKAQSYSDTLYMSKQGIYEQLTSEYGEGFDKDSATYAINNVQANWKENALKKAQSYRETLHMSKQGIYEQLISEYGEKFTKEEAQYAIDHLDN